MQGFDTENPFVLLAYPPSSDIGYYRTGQIPLGIAYLVAYCNQNGIPSVGIDFSNWEEKKVREYLRRSPAKIVGITCLTIQRQEALKLAAWVKAEMPSTIVVFGGVHATFLPHHILSTKYVDLVIRGEGERALVSVSRAVASNQPFDTIEGVSFIRDSKFVHTKDPSDPINLAMLPIPAYEYFISNKPIREPTIHSLMELVSGKPLRSANVITSRGCTLNCEFCSSSSFWGRKIRYIPIQNTLEEIKILVRNYGIDFIEFSDDDFFSDENHTKELCKGMRMLPFKLHWHCRVRVTTAKEELLLLAKESGLSAISLGIESGSAKVRRRIGKPFEFEALEKICKQLKQLGIITRFYIMIGNSQETDESIAESIELIYKLRPDIVKFLLTTVYPGTRLYKHCIRDGLMTEDVWLQPEVRAPLYTEVFDQEKLYHKLAFCISELAPFTRNFWQVGTEAQVTLKW